MKKWCSSSSKQRKARLPERIKIRAGRRNAATFSEERIPVPEEAITNLAFAGDNGKTLLKTKSNIPGQVAYPRWKKHSERSLGHEF